MTARKSTEPLTREEIRRYSRHLVLPEIGRTGQQRLKNARVLIVGAGGLGSPVSLYLAAAGIGTIGLVDADRVSVSNLQRQIVHGTSTLGEPKVLSADARLRDLNPDIEVCAMQEAFSSANAERIAEGYDLIVDGTDNFPTRYLINDVCLRLGIPFVYGAIFRMEGQVSLFGTENGPCYRCLFPEPPPPESVQTCEEAGVLGAIPGTIGTLQATEAIKWIVGIGTPLVGRLLVYDAASMTTETLEIARQEGCRGCGVDPSTIELIDYAGFCGVPIDSGPAHQLPENATIDPQTLKSRLDAGASIRILDVRTPIEWEIVHLDGSTLAPLDRLDETMEALDPDEEIVVVCRRGERSARAVLRLREAGFGRARNLTGGLTAWSRDVDPQVPVY